ncbi:hypothetical protein C6P45_002438 [Maudiozyma exigua]|uniref:YAP1 binding protein 2 n=1 Tax=Maudiozyma exigua TaxID=34358 RepID=A0A9P6VYM5_MAUEX|nr:hypothetical protein C6P45_002438 [Kazachstania exigua]
MSESIEEICDILTQAFDEQQDDLVSLMTVIDMYGTQVSTITVPEQYSILDKETYLETLDKLLSDSIINEIGWDLPKLLLSFITTENLDFDIKLSENKIISILMKIFNRIALVGNSKECLLSGCELLSELKIDIQKRDSDDDTLTSTEGKLYIPLNANEFIPDLKLHILFQLIVGCIQRIETIYPSKFLAQVINAINDFTRNNIESMNDTNFLLRRVYDFCINYNRIQNNREHYKDESGETTEDEMDKIFHDEIHLETKLIVHLITYTLNLGFKNKVVPFDLNYINDITEGKDEETEIIDSATRDICSKYYLLSIIYDIDLAKELEDYVEESCSIYERAIDNFTKQHKSNADDKEKISQFIYELSYAFSMQKGLNETKLPIDPYGILILSGIYYVEENQKCLIPELSVTDAIYLYLRSVSASLYSDRNHNKTSESVIRYWLWSTITSKSAIQLREGLLTVPDLVVTVFLQLLLLKTCSESNARIRSSSFTLLSRMLCLISENIAFDYILDTLLMCPYITARCNILSILKTMMTKPIVSVVSETTDTISNGLSSIDLNKDEKPTAAAAPKLPPRRPYILVDDDRMAALHSLVMMTLNTVTKDMNNSVQLTLLLCYMNFFVSLREKWDLTLLTSLHDKISDTFNKDTEETLPEIGFIKLANDTLQEFISSSTIQ